MKGFGKVGPAIAIQVIHGDCWLEQRIDLIAHRLKDLQLPITH